jgi:hypothetical protein
MDSRLNLNSQPPALPSSPSSSTPEPIAEQVRRRFQTPSHSKRRTLTPKHSEFSLFSLFPPNSEIFGPLFFTTCTFFFTLCKRVKRYLQSFLPLPHSRQEYPTVPLLVPKQNASAPGPTTSRSRFTDDQSRSRRIASPSAKISGTR